ncbi:MAG: hypothetical protein IT445_14225 [Phycisphaeraceae bacterium]|nr:hypothetical protein [Phycisphaeraceae bacterium]
MSPLTKALVVLVTILSVLELGMFVAYSSKHTQLNDKLKTAQSQLGAAQAKAAATQAEISAVQAKQAETFADLNAQISKLTSDLNAAITAQRSAESQILAEKARNEKTEQAIARLTAAAQQDAVLREALIGELKTSRSNEVDLRTKNVQLTDSVNELTSTSDSLDRKVRWFAEELAEANSKVDALRILLAANNVADTTAVAAAPQTTKPDTQIAGAITQVDNTTATTLVAVNVGANDGVAKGMEFMVHRGDMYLGKLVIESVDANASAGRMVLSKGSVQASDAVVAGPY